MAGIAHFEFALWVLSVLLQAAVVAYLFATAKWRRYPGLCFYLAVNVIQGVFLYYCYANWSLYSPFVRYAAWISQIPTLCMRAWALFDLCRLLLKPYSGVWGLAWRILALLAAALVSGSILTAGRTWDQVIPNLNVGLEWTTVCMLVALFLFAQSYEIEPSLPIRRLAIGFLLYSSFAIVNATVLSHWRGRYYQTWNFLTVVSFVASVLLWLSAVLQPIEEFRVAPLLPGDVYHTMTPELNLRLRRLNERLNRFWNPEADRH